jgi:hypothetical protein
VRLELAERMQCPRPHRATPLIVVARRSVDRDLVDGVAGCPECFLEAEVAAGDVVFPGAVVGESTTPSVPAAPSLPDADTDTEALTRLVALLGLAEPGGAVLLTGRYAALAAPLTAAVDVAVVAWNAAVPGGSSAVWLAEPAVPFTDGTFRAAALDAALPLPVVLDAVRSVTAGGRVLGAAALERPATVRELARDAAEWVGERTSGASGVVPLRRA